VEEEQGEHLALLFFSSHKHLKTQKTRGTPGGERRSGLVTDVIGSDWRREDFGESDREVLQQRSRQHVLLFGAELGSARERVSIAPIDLDGLELRIDDPVFQHAEALVQCYPSMISWRFPSLGKFTKSSYVNLTDADRSVLPTSPR